MRSIRCSNDPNAMSVPTYASTPSGCEAHLPKSPPFPQAKSSTRRPVREGSLLALAISCKPPTTIVGHRPRMRVVAIRPQQQANCKSLCKPPVLPLGREMSFTRMLQRTLMMSAYASFVRVRLSTCPTLPVPSKSAHRALTVDLTQLLNLLRW